MSIRAPSSGLAAGSAVCKVKKGRLFGQLPSAFFSKYLRNLSPDCHFPAFSVRQIPASLRRHHQKSVCHRPHRLLPLDGPQPAPPESGSTALRLRRDVPAGRRGGESGRKSLPKPQEAVEALRRLPFAPGGSVVGLQGLVLEKKVGVVGLRRLALAQKVGVEGLQWLAPAQKVGSEGLQRAFFFKK